MTKRKSRKKAAPKKQEAKPEPEVVEKKPEPPKREIKKPKQDLRNLKESDYPEVGELIVGTCTKITPHGGYFTIQGYEILGQSAGFVHISELSRTWVRNIRKHIREGQKSVCRVMRINPQRQEIDLSIRRVTDSQRRETLQNYKQEHRARGMLKAIGERLNIPKEKIDDQIIYPLETKYGQLYNTLERARDEGVKILLDAGLTQEIADEIESTATRELERTSVSLHGKVNVSTYDPQGMIAIQDSFHSASEATIKKKALKVDVNVVSAPEYRIQINAEDWKIAERSWKTFQDSFEKTFKKKVSNNVINLQFIRE